MGWGYDYWCIDRYLDVFLQIDWSVVCGIIIPVGVVVVGGMVVVCCGLWPAVVGGVLYLSCRTYSTVWCSAVLVLLSILKYLSYWSYFAGDDGGSSSSPSHFHR